MRLTQRDIDLLKIHFNHDSTTVFDDLLPGFGIQKTPEGQFRYFVEYEKNGTIVTHDIGKTKKRSLFEARALARKLLPKKSRPKSKISDEAKRPFRKLLRFDELKSTRGIRYTRRHLRRLEDAGKFPCRVNLAARHVAWVEDEIDDYLNKKIEERDAKN